MVDGLGGFGQLLARFRASSAWATAGLAAVPFASALAGLSPPWPPGIVALTAVVQLLLLALAYLACRGWSRRSEEHTSELQSLMRISYAVFCLKKKKKYTNR